jgi:Flp pilus assembly protein TadD/TolB-like protein/DNA-binding winged helix-turn-helix (wHTH) protein
LNADLLQGFYLRDLLIEPAKGRVTSRQGFEHLPPKAIEVLLCLARRPGELVTHEDILECVWGDRQGGHDAVSHAVSEIRHALNDHREDPRFIQTLPRRGYRLLVTPASADGNTANSILDIQTGAGSEVTGFIENMKRRGVLETGVAYLVLGWLLIQVADTTFDNLGFPLWAEPLVNFTVIGGFPIVILLSWFFEFAEGRLIKDRGYQSPKMLEGLGRNFLAIIFAFVIAGVGSGMYQATFGYAVPVAASAVDVDLLRDPEVIPIDEDSVAVLQLATFTDDERTSAFAKGLSEDLLDGLARIPGLSVSSRGDSWSLTPNATSGDVRERLRVARYVEGSVRLVDDQLGVVIQLIDSETGFHIVSRRFDYELDNFHAMQTEIRDMIVANLRPAWDRNKAGTVTLASSSTSPDAYVLYRRGVEVLYDPRTEESIEQALGYFQGALEIDPGYPAAHAGVCSANMQMFLLTRDPDDVKTAETACGEAYAVAPRLPQVLRAVARLYVVTGRNEDAKSLYNLALEQNAQDAAALRGLAGIARRQQSFDEAVRLMTRAVELQPGNWNSMNALGSIYFRVGQYENAAREFRKVAYLDPDNFAALGNLGSASLMAGDFELARHAIERSLEIEATPPMYSNLGIIHYYLGDFDKSVEVHRQAIAQAPDIHINWLNLADALHFAGNNDESRAAFRKSAELSEIQLQVNSADIEALTLLAWARAMTGHPEEGVTLAARAVELDSNDPYSHYYHALTLIRNGEIERAIDAIDRAIENGYSANMLRAEPYLQELKSNARFNRLVSKADK